MNPRKPNESFSDYTIRILWETGRLFEVPQSQLGTLNLRDQIVIDALIDLTKFHEEQFTRRSLEHHNRLPVFDGQVGPATDDLLHKDILTRCPVPDYAPPKGVVFQFDDPALQEVVLAMQQAEPALGVGNWKGCHSFDGVHCVSVLVNQANLPSHLQPVFLDVLRIVQKAYADVGLLILFLDAAKKDLLTGSIRDIGINIDMSFVRSSDGWIGLAIVGTNQGCSSRIWCRYLATYTGGGSPATITQQWVSLIKHELGHNCGFMHTQGGVMNPSLINGLPHEWAANDPTTPKLKQQFSGVPVPVPGQPKPDPKPDDPKPPSDIQAQLDELFKVQRRQQIMLEYLIQKD